MIDQNRLISRETTDSATLRWIDQVDTSEPAALDDVVDSGRGVENIQVSAGHVVDQPDTVGRAKELEPVVEHCIGSDTQNDRFSTAQTHASGGLGVSRQMNVGPSHRAQPLSHDPIKEATHRAMKQGHGRLDRGQAEVDVDRVALSGPYGPTAGRQLEALLVALCNDIKHVAGTGGVPGCHAGSHQVVETGPAMRVQFQIAELRSVTQQQAYVLRQPDT